MENYLGRAREQERERERELEWKVLGRILFVSLLASKETLDFFLVRLVSGSSGGGGLFSSSSSSAVLVQLTLKLVVRKKKDRSKLYYSSPVHAKESA